METNKSKNVVLMLSHHYPKTAIHAGKPTHFKEKLLDGRKIHTCRTNFIKWYYNIDKVNDKGYVMSVREWNGKPYGKGVKQTVIKEYRKVGYQSLTMKYNHETDELECFIDGKRYTEIATLAKNDGMTLEEFKNWFFGKDMKHNVYNGIIIHFTEFRYK